MKGREAPTASQGVLRIGEMAKRSGVSVELLRAWERRYGLLHPVRSEGGFRLYSEHDLARVVLMKRYLDDGIAASEAARLTVNDAVPDIGGPAPAGPLLEERTNALSEQLAAMDEPGAQQAFDRLLADFQLETVMAGAVLPILRRIGAGDGTGGFDIAQEHFASALLRGRLLGLARGWGGTGTPILMACLPGEMHDLGLITFGIVASRRGFAITHLGQDTPVETISHCASGMDAFKVVVLGMVPARFTDRRQELVDLAAQETLMIAGSGADAALAEELDCEFLEGDPVSAALALGG